MVQKSPRRQPAALAANAPAKRAAGATAHTARALDVARFCRDSAVLEGEWTLDEFPRFAESVLRGADGFADTAVQWEARGGMRPVRGEAPQCVIDLRVRAEPVFECQRCLQPVRLPMALERRFRFVTGEDEAARQDEEAPDDEDVLAMVPRFDLAALAEDELILALPLVPRHAQCSSVATGPQPGRDEGLPDPYGETSHRPFAAALASLQRKTGPKD